MLLTTAYFPPIEYFAILAGYSVVYMDAGEAYSKQSYRNRCWILGANGIENLLVPVVHAVARKQGIAEVRVDYSTPWVRKTQKAIDSAYYNSAYFEYYRDSLYEILDSRPERLWDLNMRLIEYFCAKIGIAPQIEPIVGAGEVAVDIHPKHPNSIMKELGLERPYWQVFSERFGFVPGLSIMDLLFNEGPESICYLKK